MAVGAVIQPRGGELGVRRPCCPAPLTTRTLSTRSGEAVVVGAGQGWCLWCNGRGCGGAGDCGAAGACGALLRVVVSGVMASGVVGLIEVGVLVVVIVLVAEVLALPVRLIPVQWL